MEGHGKNSEVPAICWNASFWNDHFFGVGLVCGTRFFCPFRNFPYWKMDNSVSKNSRSTDLSASLICIRRTAHSILSIFRNGRSTFQDALTSPHPTFGTHLHVQGRSFYFSRCTYLTSLTCTCTCVWPHSTFQTALMCVKWHPRDQELIYTCTCTFVSRGGRKYEIDQIAGAVK